MTQTEADQALAAGAESFRRRRIEVPAAKEPWTGPGWLNPSAPEAVMSDPLKYARALVSVPLVETVGGGTGVLKVTLTLGPRPGDWHVASVSPGGEVVFWREYGSMVQGLFVGDQVTIWPLEINRPPQPWKDEQSYMRRVDCTAIWWLSRIP
jgi:hypothetical protein